MKGSRNKAKPDAQIIDGALGGIKTLLKECSTFLLSIGEH